MSPSDEILYSGTRFRVARRTRQLANGETAQRDVILHPGAVVILPWVDKDSLCLIRNVRVAVGETLLELPAGTLEPPEPPIETARRELVEETGYRCESLELWHEFYASPGILSERMYLYSAAGLTPGEQRLEHGEEIQTVITPLADALRMALDGTIQDAKTLVGILLSAQRRRER